MVVSFNWSNLFQFSFPFFVISQFKETYNWINTFADWLPPVLGGLLLSDVLKTLSFHNLSSCSRKESLTLWVNCWDGTFKNPISFMHFSFAFSHYSASSLHNLFSNLLSSPNHLLLFSCWLNSTRRRNGKLWWNEKFGMCHIWRKKNCRKNEAKKS